MTTLETIRNKYPIKVPGVMASSETSGPMYITALWTSLVLWIVYSMCVGYGAEWQVLLVLVAFASSQWKNLSTNSLNRSKLDLKAKGLDIKDHYLNALMPWDWLTNVEIRQKSLSFIPNYVYFKFKNGSDVLILWDDIRETMDSTTLISCVRTWAPRANIIGDAKLTKSESIATYTEIWLKDISNTKTERRLRADQLLTPGTVLSESYVIDRVLS